MASTEQPTDIPTDVSPFWSGIDVTTPDGHILSTDRINTVHARSGGVVRFATRSSEDAFAAIIAAAR